MIKDLISVIMPTYNDAEHIESALDDLLFQNYSNFELIIINDGSTDNTSEILESYALKDNRISVYNKKNGGTGSALNIGFSKAKGEFGTWVSSDDNKEVDFLKTLVTFLKNNQDVEYVCSAYYSSYFKRPFKAYHKIDGQFRYCEGLGHDSSMSGDQIIVDDWPKINYKHCFQGVCFMFTMRLKNTCGDYIELPGEDYHMSMKMSLKSRVGYIDTILGKHNNPDDSLSMVNRNCVLDAEKITRQLYTSSNKWNLKIPKIASFYCSVDFTETQKQSILLFKKINPDWSVHLYRDSENKNSLITDLEEEMACLIKTIKLDSIKITADKLLFLKCYIMLSQGGLCLDPEVLLDLPMSELCIHTPTTSDFVYYHNGKYSSSLLLCSPQSKVFKKILSFMKNIESPIDNLNDLFKKAIGNPKDLKSQFYMNKFYNLNDSYSLIMTPEEER